MSRGEHLCDTAKPGTGEDRGRFSESTVFPCPSLTVKTIPRVFQHDALPYTRVAAYFLKGDAAMSETPSRQDTVEDNIDAAVTKYGADNLKPILLTILTDISVSLAMLVDSSST